jgi:hypothetical protein
MMLSVGETDSFATFEDALERQKLLDEVHKTLACKTN